jgi:hypothetical protein
LVRGGPRAATREGRPPRARHASRLPYTQPLTAHAPLTRAGGRPTGPRVTRSRQGPASPAPMAPSCRVLLHDLLLPLLAAAAAAALGGARPAAGAGSTLPDFVWVTSGEGTPFFGCDDACMSLSTDSTSYRAVNGGNANFRVCASERKGGGCLGQAALCCPRSRPPRAGPACSTPPHRAPSAPPPLPRSLPPPCSGRQSSSTCPTAAASSGSPARATTACPAAAGCRAPLTRATSCPAARPLAAGAWRAASPTRTGPGFCSLSPRSVPASAVPGPVVRGTIGR